MLLTKTFPIKIMLFFKKVHSNACFSEIIFLQNRAFQIARKTQNLRILRGKLNENVIFVCKVFFKICFQK